MRRASQRSVSDHTVIAWKISSCWTLFTFQAMLSLFRLRHQRYWQHVRATKITQSFCGRRERCASWRSVWGVIAMSVLVKDVLVATQRRASCSGSRVNIARHGPATKRRLPQQRTLLTSNLRTCRLADGFTASPRLGMIQNPTPFGATTRSWEKHFRLYVRRETNGLQRTRNISSVLQTTVFST